MGGTRPAAAATEPSYSLKALDYLDEKNGKVSDDEKRLAEDKRRLAKELFVDIAGTRGSFTAEDYRRFAVSDKFKAVAKAMQAQPWKTPTRLLKIVAQADLNQLLTDINKDHDFKLSARFKELDDMLALLQEVAPNADEALRASALWAEMPAALRDYKTAIPRLEKHHQIYPKDREAAALLEESKLCQKDQEIREILSGAKAGEPAVTIAVSETQYRVARAKVAAGKQAAGDWLQGLEKLKASGIAEEHTLAKWESERAVMQDRLAAFSSASR